MHLLFAFHHNFLILSNFQEPIQFYNLDKKAFYSIAFVLNPKDLNMNDGIFFGIGNRKKDFHA